MADELRDFLRSRRSRVLPQDVGIAPYGVRRVPGLRRDELARLSGVSVDYYTELEQGRAVRPSAAVLDALARALGLEVSEREHLHRLASRAPVRPTPVSETARPELWALLQSLSAHPAILLGRRLDVLAWNGLGAALIADFGALEPRERNIVRLLFLDPGVRARYVDWETVAADAVAHLRLAAVDADDRALAELVGELTLRSEAFTRIWARHDVAPKTRGVKVFDHPVAGRLELAYETLTVADDAQSLVIYRDRHALQSPSILRIAAASK